MFVVCRRRGGCVSIICNELLSSGFVGGALASMASLQRFSSGCWLRDGALLQYRRLWLQRVADPKIIGASQGPSVVLR